MFAYLVKFCCNWSTSIKPSVSCSVDDNEFNEHKCDINDQSERHWNWRLGLYTQTSAMRWNVTVMQRL